MRVWKHDIKDVDKMGVSDFIENMDKVKVSIKIADGLAIDFWPEKGRSATWRTKTSTFRRAINLMLSLSVNKTFTVEACRDSLRLVSMHTDTLVRQCVAL